MKRRGLALCAGLLLLLGLPGYAVAFATVDQKSDSWSTYVQVLGEMGQTFTAGLTGSMTGADVMVFSKSGTTTVALQIEKLGWMGFPDGTPLRSTTSVVGTAENWVHFSFQPLGITAGQSYAIVFHAASTCYAYEANANPYPNGRAVNNPHGAWGDLLSNPNHDLVFRTWMNLPPPVMTLLHTPTPAATQVAAATPMAAATPIAVATPTVAETPAPDSTSSATVAPSESAAASEPPATGPSATETLVVTAPPAAGSGSGEGGSSGLMLPIVAAAVVVMAGLGAGLLFVLLRRRRRVAEE